MTDQFTVIVHDAAWHVLAVQDGQVRAEPVTADVDATVDDRVDAARERMADLGYAQQPIVLAVASTWCLSATIPTDHLERSNRRQTMGFRLEEHLPISAEDVVADYLNLGNEQALGVCVAYEAVSELVAAFERRGVRVRHICPAPLLAAAYAGEQLEADAVLIRVDDEAGADSPGSYDLIELSKGKPTRWWWLADDRGERSRRLASLPADEDQPCKLATIGCNGHSVPADQAKRLDPVAVESAGGHGAAALQAARVLDGAAVPWIDLRTDRLAAPDRFDVYRKPMIALAAAAAVLFVAIIGVSWWRGGRYADLASQYRGDQRAVYREAMGDRPPPGGLLLRAMRNEQTKLSFLSGRGGDDGDSALPATFSALNHLSAILDALPKHIRFRVLELAIGPERVRMSGEARSLAEAERIAIALRDTQAYDVESPRTNRLKDQGVSFVFTATPKPEPAEPGPDGGAGR